MNSSTAASTAATPAAQPFDLHLEAALRYAVAIGAVLVVLLPDARGSSELIGWLPLWLLGMPSAAWWVVRRATPDRHPLQRHASSVRRQPHPHARRRVLGQHRPALPKAA